MSAYEMTIRTNDGVKECLIDCMKKGVNEADSPFQFEVKIRERLEFLKVCGIISGYSVANIDISDDHPGNSKLEIEVEGSQISDSNNDDENFVVFFDNHLSQVCLKPARGGAVYLIFYDNTF